MILNALLAFGIVMSSATQIVVPRIHSTFGELALVLWILLSLGRTLAGGQLHFTPALARLGSFWLGLAMLSCLGVVIGFLTKVLYAPYVLHDTMAYVLLAFVTCLSAAKPDAARHLRECAWFVVAFANVTFVIQFGLGFGWLHLSSVSPWYWDRFRGWSQNPNQLALYCALYGPLALHLATTSGKPLAKAGGLIALALPVTAGLMTKSDTYAITAILTCFIFAGLRLRTWLTSGSAGAATRRQLVILLLLASAPLALSLAPYATGDFGGLAKSVTRDRGGIGIEETTERRRQLWSEALQRGLKSISLGLGPGPHLEIRPVNEPLYQVTPFEAHNTFLDLYTQGGLLAVFLLLWIGGSAAMFAWRAKLEALFALAVTLTLFAVPHLIVRHPVVWFAITLCLATGSARRHSPAPRRELAAI
jgi:hypothetical protein